MLIVTLMGYIQRWNYILFLNSRLCLNSWDLLTFQTKRKGQTNTPSNVFLHIEVRFSKPQKKTITSTTTTTTTTYTQPTEQRISGSRQPGLKLRDWDADRKLLTCSKLTLRYKQSNLWPPWPPTGRRLGWYTGNMLLVARRHDANHQLHFFVTNCFTLAIQLTPSLASCSWAQIVRLLSRENRTRVSRREVSSLHKSVTFFLVCVYCVAEFILCFNNYSISKNSIFLILYPSFLPQYHWISFTKSIGWIFTIYAQSSEKFQASASAGCVILLTGEKP